MLNDPFPTSPPTGCEAIQAQLSDLADSGVTTLPPELRTHLDACPACAHFAEAWFPTPPAALLANLASAQSAARLRDRILDAAATPPNMLPFTPKSPAATHPVRTVWLGRIAACLLVAGLATWLLDPIHSTGRKPTVSTAAPTLSQNLLKTERRTQREQRAIQTALVDGGREVHGNVAWAASALDL